MSPKSKDQGPKPGVFWTAPAERSGNGALAGANKRHRASLAAAIPIAPAVTNANDIRDIKPPVEIPNGWEWLWVTLGVLAGAVILFILWKWLQKRRANIPVEPPVPAHVRAKHKLEEALALISQPKPFVIAVSDTARTYLEERFDFRAPERTTEEFLHELSDTDLLLPDQKESLGRFLESCDLVKFAKYEPREPELRELHSSAVRLVEETKPADSGTGILPVSLSGSASEHTGETPVPPSERAPQPEIANRKS